MLGSPVGKEEGQPPPPFQTQGNTGLVTLSWCGGPNGFGHCEQTGKEDSGGHGGLWLLRVAQQTALRGGGLIALKLPDDAGPIACGPLGPVTLPNRDSVCRGCLYVPPPLLHHPLPSSLHPVALLPYGTHSALPLVELPLGSSLGCSLGCCRAREAPGQGVCALVDPPHSLPPPLIPPASQYADNARFRALGGGCCVTAHMGALRAQSTVAAHSMPLGWVRDRKWSKPRACVLGM